MITKEKREYVEQCKAAIEAKKERIKRLQVMARGHKSELWTALKADLELSIKTLERERENIESKPAEQVKDLAVDHAEVRALARARLAYKGIIQNVEMADAKIERLNDDIAELQRNIQQTEPGKPARRHQEVV